VNLKNKCWKLKRYTFFSNPSIDEVNMYKFLKLKSTVGSYVGSSYESCDFTVGL
jgi:hypothetical protein